ncbi:hypothetical protein [Thalassomonas actiniarum]|uniref:Uncharacterized protein n=1 Tax=Thalassomonas actiniarum TaxID=485447 RepID=A0AAF0C5E4_9GAMM|nr:hypothetical protein [Thalassomonas actiniarum]WDE01006.1 hypothetical protein SG35_010440 [Thalassomonas actiniarum]
MAKIVLIILGACLVGASEAFYMQLLVTGSLLLIAYQHRDDINIRDLCGMMLAVTLVEIVLFEFFIVTRSEVLSSMAVNAIIFGAHFVMDVAMYILVSNRVHFTRDRLKAKGEPTEHIFTYSAEFALISVFVVFMTVDLMALLENFIRHLDEFGVSAETAKMFSGWNWLYYHYEVVKGILMGLTFFFLWTITIGEGQKEYKKKEMIIS